MIEAEGRRNKAEEDGVGSWLALMVRGMSGRGRRDGEKGRKGATKPFTRHRELIPRRTLMTANNLKYEFV